MSKIPPHVPPTVIDSGRVAKLSPAGTSISAWITGVLVGDVFDEEQDQHVVIVLAGVHAAAQLVAGLPEGGIEFEFLQGHMFLVCAAGPARLHPNGTHFKGEIVLTLVYAPPVDGRHGAEYIRANVNAHFGSYDPDADGVIKHHGIVPLDTPDKQDLYEAAMIDHGFKWSPVKVYRARFRQGKAGCNFRLYLELLRRAGEVRQPEPQRAIVLVSMRGISDDLPVYNDGIRALRAVNWTTSHIASAMHIRV